MAYGKGVKGFCRILVDIFVILNFAGNPAKK
jgi:hypothetical protein